MSDPFEVLRVVDLEVRRCRQNVDRGGSIEMWVNRLSWAAEQFEQASRLIRAEERALRALMAPGSPEAP